MKKIYALFLLILLIPTSLLLAQIGEKSYPAPKENISTKKALFIGLFDDKNVGNLHLFTDEKMKSSGLFKGKKISKRYIDFFPSELWTYFKSSKYRPRALYSIRGDGEEWYIVRISDAHYDNALFLYEWGGKKLAKKILLADTDCRNGNCKRTDSWIRDIDGDTYLDIIQKVVEKNAKGQVINTIIKAYSIDSRGVFVQNPQLSFNKTAYKMHAF